MKYNYGTKNSYSKGYFFATPSELAEKVINEIKFNRYRGGKIHSTEATLDYYKQGYIFNNNMIIFGTKAEFKEFEKLIKPYMKYFTSRKYYN